MLIFENFLVALQNLRANPMRSVLTLIGIAVGIGAVLYVVVLGEITQRRIKERMEALGTNVLNIRPGFSRMHGVRTGANVVSLKWSDAKEIQDYSNVIVKTVPSYSSSVVAEYRDKNWNTRVTGTTPDDETVNNDKISEGRFFTEAELNQRARVCILGANVHKELFGSESPIGKSILLNSKRFQVIGLLEAKGESWWNPDDQVLIPLTTAQERLFGVDHLSTILAQMRSSSDYDEALFDIETILRRNHRLRPDQENDFRVRRQDFFLSTIQETNQEIADFIIIIALVSLFVGGIGIANIMLVSVTERIREIGVRRAIGAKKLYIILQFLTEAVLLGIVGGVLGILGGTIFNEMSIGGELILPWSWIAYSFMICGGIGIIAGLYPAIRAANVDVIESLRYE
ncbi:MAG: FtsX-like permease family protein [Calditrichaeota bacterium]|nr:MAG: FtsX-like permease family protein [Calditrichota bacterium]